MTGDIPSTTGQINSGGRCPRCGQWVSYGPYDSHQCLPSPFVNPFSPPIPVWAARQGWMCPNCGSAHAPSVQTCPMQVCSPNKPGAES
jgi:hypothetical protein